MTGSTIAAYSASMKLFGSTVGPMKPRSDYQFWNEKKEMFSMFPRNYVMSHEGTWEEVTLKLRWVVKIVNHAEQIALLYDKSNDPGLLKVMEEAKKIIPRELRICNSCFTSMALVGNVMNSSGRSHPHHDANDVVSTIITLGKEDVTWGSTLYYDGVRKEEL